MNEYEYVLFDKCMYYAELSEYMYRKGDNDKGLEMEHKREAVKDIINALGLTDKYIVWIETGNL